MKAQINILHLAKYILDNDKDFNKINSLDEDGAAETYYHYKESLIQKGNLSMMKYSSAQDLSEKSHLVEIIKLTLRDILTLSAGFLTWYEIQKWLNVIYSEKNS